MSTVHIHLHTRRLGKTKDADTKYIAKKDFQLPNGRICRNGTVFYKVAGGGFRPWFEKTGAGYNFKLSDFQIEN